MKQKNYTKLNRHVFRECIKQKKRIKDGNSKCTK